MSEISSPNFNDRDPKVALEYIVLHYTGMQDAASAVARLCDPSAQVSAHYVIDEDGSVLQLVDEAKRAWHAGSSFWRGIKDMNSASIGIELVNPGHEFGYRLFPSTQTVSLKKLLREILARHQMSPATALLAHSDIAPSRKQDPGELFPWQALAQEGLGLWPLPQPEDFSVSSEQAFLEELCSLGYDINSPYEAVLAFQRRYYPERLTGKTDEQTTARIRALLRQR